MDEHMTLPRYEALMKYWRREPPVHASVAMYLLGKSEPGPLPEPGQEDRTQTPENKQALAELFAIFPLKGPVPRG